MHLLLQVLFCRLGGLPRLGSLESEYFAALGPVRNAPMAVDFQA